ncbi:MAG: adenosylmethionine decarboxylase [Kosmotogaceae bacterium]
MKKVKALGRHLIAEFFSCSNEALNDLDFISENLKIAAAVAGATIVDSSFHRFLPHGISGVVVIAESHLTIHTWPEYGYAAIDLFTCGDEVNPWKAFDYLRDILSADRTEVYEYLRGVYEKLNIPEYAPYKVSE